MILVTGKGRLANELVNLSDKDNDIVSLSKREMDITDEYMVSDVIKGYMMRPDYPRYIIHTAALTKPMDINDKNPIMSLSTNIVGTANIVKICHKYGIKLIYISTDFVYQSNIFADEEAPLNPPNNYGWSKLGGECAVRIVPNNLILRCSLCDIPFRHKVAFNDVYRNSITHKEVAKIILKLKDETGIINVGGVNQSVYDFVLDNQGEIETKSCDGKVPSLELDINKLRSKLDKSQGE